MRLRSLTSLYRLTYTSALLGLSLANCLNGATAAFGGKVIGVKPVDSKDKNRLKYFTVEIDYFDYISRGKFGRHSKVGESIDQSVLKIGSVCVIDGRMVNASTFAKAIQPNLWGYFYETTWLDLQTTKNFQWGEIVSVGKNTFTLRVHHTHKSIHIDANPPIEVTIPYASNDEFRIEEKSSDLESALKPGNWIQIHEPREQRVAAWTKASAYDPSEQLPVEEGRRGFANDLSCRAVLGSVRTKKPDAVLDLSAQVECERWLSGKSEKLTLDARKVSFVLDGKLAPPKIAAKAGRNAVLCHYRTETRPHKILVRSNDDAVRGNIVAYNGKSIRVATTEGGIDIDLEPDAQFSVDGVFVDRKAFSEKGTEVVIYPKRGRTLIAFPPVSVD